MAYTNITKIAIDDKLLDVDAVVEQAVNQRMGNIIDMIHPVGDTIIRLDNVNPATLYAGTTWQLVSQGKAIIGASSSYPLGSEGGSADAVVVEHTHTQNSHNHTQNEHNHTQNAHNHKPLNPDGTTPKFLSTDKNYTTTSAREYTPTKSGGARYMVTTETGASHVAEDTTTANTTATNQNARATNQPATAVNQSTGVSGVGKNMPPYKAFNIWLRTA